MKQIIFTTILILVSCFVSFAQESENLCPSVSLTNTIPINDVPVKFTAEISEEINKYDVEYKWEIEGGKIIEGQGTKSLKVLYYEEYDEINTVATLEIRGLPEICNSTFSEKFYAKIVRSKPIKFWSRVLLDEYKEVSLEDKMIKLDKFFARLQEDKTAEGFIRLQIGTLASLFQHLQHIDNHISFKKFNKKRISFAVVNSDEEQTQFWIVPRKAELPNCEKCIIVKAEKSRKKLRKLFPINKNTT